MSGLNPVVLGLTGDGGILSEWTDARLPCPHTGHHSLA